MARSLKLAMPAVLSSMYPSFYLDGSTAKRRHTDICDTYLISFFKMSSNPQNRLGRLLGSPGDPQEAPRGSPGGHQGPPGGPQETPRDPQETPRGPPESPQKRKPIYKHLSGVKLPIARLWRPVCYIYIYIYHIYI